MKKAKGGVLFTPPREVEKAKGGAFFPEKGGVSGGDGRSRRPLNRSQVQGKQLVFSAPALLLLLLFGPFIPPPSSSDQRRKSSLSLVKRWQGGGGGRGGGVRHREEEGRIGGHLADELNFVTM